MTLVKSTSAIHQDLQAAMRTHNAALEALTVKVDQTGEMISAADMGIVTSDYLTALAHIISDTVHTLGGLAVQLGAEELALGPGVDFS